MRKKIGSTERIAWQVYAALFCGVQLVGILKMEWIAEEVAMSAWSILGCVPLFGYAFKFKSAVPLVWKVYFLSLMIVVGVFAVFLSFAALNSGFNEIFGKALLAMVVQLPFWYAVWAYAYRSKGLWASSA